MEDKKIDRLFQEKLKDLEVVPNPELWQKIEEQLPKKKKRRILPIWWFSGGVAASLLLFVLLNPFTKNDTLKHEEIIIAAPNNEQEHVNTKEFLQEKEVVKNEESQEKKPSKSIETLFVETTETKEKRDSKPNSNYLKSRDKSLENNSIAKNEDFLITKTKVDKKETEKTIESSIENIEKPLEQIVDQKKMVDKVEKGKKDFIAEVSKEEEPEETNSKVKKWSVTPMVGFVSSNSLKQASALDPVFNENDISSNETLSYGIKVSYEINDKWSIQSGIQKQELSYTTENVGLSVSATTSNSLDNVVVSNTNSFSFFSLQPTEGDASSDDAVTGNDNYATFEQGSIQQVISYIEIPVEVRYKVASSKRLTTNIVSGFSALLLEGNSISLASSSSTEELGTANNLNKANISGNLGVDFDIQLSEKLNLNINPMFKTQLNTFSENSNGFIPFTIGVHTGLKYNF